MRSFCSLTGSRTHQALITDKPLIGFVKSCEAQKSDSEEVCTTSRGYGLTACPGPHPSTRNCHRIASSTLKQPLHAASVVFRAWRAAIKRFPPFFGIEKRSKYKMMRRNPSTSSIAATFYLSAWVPLLIHAENGPGRKFAGLPLVAFGSCRPAPPSCWLRV